MSVNAVTIPLDYDGYVYVGHAQGVFEPETGRKVPYYNMFVIFPARNAENSDYHASGFRADKLKCVGPDVWDGLNYGDKIRVFCDPRGRVIQAALDQ